MTQYIKRLPAVFQTVTEKKFFDATIDQVFTKKDSDQLSGYIGRREPGIHNPIKDFYIPEPSKDRTWWQLEATSYARTVETNKSNIYFYDDILNKIKYHGGNILNQDRLFSSEFYSFGPPIDYDMFINYHNYYWVEQGLPTISISGVLSSDIIGKISYTTPETATPANLKLTSGMTIALTDDLEYSTPHKIENFGGCSGIGLVPPFPDFTAGSVFEFLPWDGQLELSNGRIISNIYWDGNTWDTQVQPGNGDYITIERGALDRNAWSRTNKWFHIDAITSTIGVTNTAFPANATRALRPIIQFIANLELYKSGTQFRSEIDYGFRDDLYGQPLLRADYQGRLLTEINGLFDISMRDGDLVGFFNDMTPFNFWDMHAWDIDPIPEWDAGVGIISQYIYRVKVHDNGTVTFEPHTSWETPVLEGDIVFITEDGPYNAAQRGQTWYYSDGIWQKAFNDKVSINQPPLFLLRDHNGVELDDPVTYPYSNFRGSKIFSYKINTESGATIDPVLRFPIVYKSLGQASDVVFCNDLITERYVYGNNKLPINGYYYYKTTTDPVMFNNWNLHDPCDCNNSSELQPINCITSSKQRVIDRFVVGYEAEHKFKLSVIPFGFPDKPDIIVSVNGKEIKDSSLQPDGYSLYIQNNKVYVDLSTYLSNLLLTKQKITPVVEAHTYTYDMLNDDALGYFQIPQQLEANPSQLEVEEISGSELIQHFSSIISNQVGSEGVSFGGNNNYRDTRKNRTLGKYILQNVSPLLKTMLVSSDDDLDVIKGIRFSQDEYTKFKNKFVKTANILINQGFDPLQHYNDTVNIGKWVDEILKIINISKEHSDAFAHSCMIASGNATYYETHTVPTDGMLQLEKYVDLSNFKNCLYIYDITTNEELLVIDRDYQIISSNLSIELQINTDIIVPGSIVHVALYEDMIPSYIPATPSKVGTYPVYVPGIQLDTTYATPTGVIIGHDGSKTIVYNDYRDSLLLELEKRIYNSIQRKFRNQYRQPLRIEEIRPGYFRKTRYSRSEYVEITEPFLNKWAAKNRANYRANDWETSKTTTPVSSLWKLYNYRLAEDATTGTALNLPGHWRGIFIWYYDTIHPDTRPWEMLGFSIEPTWWRFEYGNPVINSYGQEVWTSTASGNNILWDDLENGIIRQGPSAIYNPITKLPQSQPMWARPGLSSIIPVDNAGEIISVMDLFNVVFSGNVYEPFDGYDLEWKFGDGSPVESAWMSTSTYTYTAQEILYITAPAVYGETCWDTLYTENSPGKLVIDGIEGPVLSNKNWQFVQNDLLTHNDPFFQWMRPKNKDQYVHAEKIDNILNIRFGYQQWISDRILFLGKDITSTFGHKVRTLDVNLANKLAGFTNKDTTNTYIEAITPGASTNSLGIPSNNFDIFLHKSPVVDTYSYSGVIIRGLSDGTFAIYGYDLLNSEFIVIDRSDAKLIDVTVGGTPAEFKYFTIGETYNPGDIVRYNGVYYLSLVTQEVQKFISTGWKKLNALPTIGGISVSYKPISSETISRIPYGTVMKTPQEVFDFLISWGAYLESRGWKFEEVDHEINQLNDWLTSGKQFLFWLNTSWATDASIQLSPLANKAVLEVKRGYPGDVEKTANGVYSVLDKEGFAIQPNNTLVNRDGRLITVEPSSIDIGGIYFLQVNTYETEHIIVFDNTTNFNDVIYSPLLRARQHRLKFIGSRSNGWYGKMEAPGYLVVNNAAVPNYDTIVDAMRYYYDPNVTIDNQSFEDLGRSLIGYESKSYLDNLQISNDVQYLFYQGVIRQKGTVQAFDKLFRSTKVQTDEVIEVFEEWALKLGDFGNTIEQVSTEIILKPEQHTGEVIVARLNYKPSAIGFVRQINILNAENTYIHVPRIIISPPDADPLDNSLTQPLRQAKAYAVLDLNNKISRIDITDAGYGYLKAPYIEIDSGAEAHNLDKLYSVWQGYVLKDETLDNIVNIDIDEVDKWIVRPNDPSYSLTFPTTTKKEYAMPNAGYVHFNDVKWSSFDVSSAVINWGTQLLNPSKNDTIWIAKTFTDDWDVYKLIDVTDKTTVDVIRADSDELQLRVHKTFDLRSQMSLSGEITDFGNIVVLQAINAHAIGESSKHTEPAIAELTIEDGAITSISVVFGGLGYEESPPVYIIGDGFGAEAIATIVDGSVTAITLLNPGAGYTTVSVEVGTPPESGTGEITSITVLKTGAGYITAPSISIGDASGYGYGAVARAVLIDGRITDIEILNPGTGYVSPVISISPPDVQPVENYAVAFQYFNSDDEYNYYTLTTLDGIALTDAEIPGYSDFTNLLLFKTMRWKTTPIEPLLPTYVGLGDFVWVDDVAGKWVVFNIQAEPGRWDIKNWDASVIDFWSPNYGWDVEGPMYFNPHRIEEPLINTSLFESAQVFATGTGNQLVRLPIYDPFKDILPGPAVQNLKYISLQDPAKYNITGDSRLFSDNILFGEHQVGNLWWDLSNTRFVYYEQPKSLDGKETDIDNLVYRRDNWGKIFPGSNVLIYEWVKSSTPPSEYTGSGIPKNINNYVRIETSNRFNDLTEINYYFWVSGKIDKPNRENRTLTSSEVSRLIQSPKSQNFVFFCPIQQTDISNSYMFYNVQEILSYQGDNVQIKYRLSDREHKEHTQWSLYREGDANSLVTDQYWNKMVDSLCGYTKLLEVSDEYSNGIIIAKDLPWDIYGWDISLWDSATSTTEIIYGEVLPVPDPMLTEGEKYGIEYRPRQGMFKNIHAARKIFVQAANELLSHIPIRDNDPGWNTYVKTSMFWEYTDWFADGYENAIPTSVFGTLLEATQALSLRKLKVGDIVKVVEGTPDGRYVLYAVTQTNPVVSTLSLEEVCVQLSAIKILDRLYSDINLYGLAVELRELLGALRTKVLINNNKIGQNKLFFSMMNYVLSEQKSPDWLFKTSYIYIKEKNLPLEQSQLYIPDQIDNIIAYIKDVKPYHTKIRDYTSVYITSDVAEGTAIDSYKISTKIKFGPYNYYPWDCFYWDTNQWDTYTMGPWPPLYYIIDGMQYNEVVDQFISRDDVHTVELTTYDSTKKGYSNLYPYTFTLDTINLDNPQNIITPHNIVGVIIDNSVLRYGKDYYVENNNNGTYTAYFFNNPGNTVTPVAVVWINGGRFQQLENNPYRHEVANGYPVDNLTSNIDTRLPVNDISDISALSPYVISPYVGWGDSWECIDDPIGQILIDNGGTKEIPWDAPLTPIILPVTISFKENTNKTLTEFYRNSNYHSGILTNTVYAPSSLSEHIDVLMITADRDILPTPHQGMPGVIWINGERIEYKMKVRLNTDTWELRLVRRGTNGTAPTEHPSLSRVFVERLNIFPQVSNDSVWNIAGTQPEPIPSSETSPGVYTSISSVPIGGLWYSRSPQATYLKQGPGEAIN